MLWTNGQLAEAAAEATELALGAAVDNHPIGEQDPFERAEQHADVGQRAGPRVEEIIGRRRNLIATLRPAGPDAMIVDPITGRSGREFAPTPLPQILGLCLALSHQAAESCVAPTQSLERLVQRGEVFAI